MASTQMHNPKNPTPINQSQGTQVKALAQMHNPKNSTLISQLQGTKKVTPFYTNKSIIWRIIMNNNSIQDQRLSVKLIAIELQPGLEQTLKNNHTFPSGIINSNIFQSILKPVALPVKSIILATLMTVSFSSTMAILGGTSQVSANPLPSWQANPFQINDVITSPSSIVGNWEGSLYPQGDDTSTYVEMVINPGVSQQGTWKFIGENNSILDSGIVVASLSSNNVTLKFKQKNKKTSWFFKCKLQNNNKLSGEQVGNTNWKLTLNKAN
ncbi:hypothetical protein H6F78_07900 [Coleofasciculus sp. FACHB-64]|uniref:hypothetical protein n=1 Tax=Cyanophyceae TaxID=3028117 RepID=UPI0016859E33|nr:MULTISPECIES: hypothetical protein [unclassified Coleofasciculus]MBD1840015.1 hypothetical protein [Coleofasciculus sp. FACHB-501]MBD2045518.1 hypothetical protein [Coleofasciculus sp. FACHB-64]